MSVINRVLRDMPPLAPEAQQLPGVRAVAATRKNSAFLWLLAPAALLGLWFIWPATEQQATPTMRATAPAATVPDAAGNANRTPAAENTVVEQADTEIDIAQVRGSKVPGGQVPDSLAPGNQIRSGQDHRVDVSRTHSHAPATETAPAATPDVPAHHADDREMSRTLLAVNHASVTSPASVTSQESATNPESAATPASTPPISAAENLQKNARQLTPSAPDEMKHSPSSATVVTTTVTPAAASVQPNAQSRLLQQLQARGAAAIPELEQRLHEQPDQPALRKLLGQLLLREQQAARARRWLGEQTPALSRDTEWHALLALAELHSGEASSAAMRYQQLTQLEPHQGRHHAGLALALDQLQQFAAARESYRLALRDPDLDAPLRQWALQRLQAPVSALEHPTSVPAVSTASGAASSASSAPRTPES